MLTMLLGCGNVLSQSHIGDIQWPGCLHNQVREMLHSQIRSGVNGSQS